MNTKLVMTSATILLGLVGVALLFAPEEVIKLYDPNIGSVKGLGLLIQQLGAAFLGFVALDWISRHALLGGIYGRPVVVGNFTHFAIGSFLLVRAAIDGPSNAVVWFTLTAYALFTVVFGVILFTTPRKKDIAS